MKPKLVINLILIISVIFSFKVFAQTDEVIVPPGPEIFDFIMGDTTSTGERNVPGRVYKLERGQIYIFTETLEIDFDFYLVADDDDPNNPVRPPMLVKGVHPDGSLVENLINITGDNIKIGLKNLLFQGVPMDGKYRNDWTLALSGTGTNVHMEIDNCVFNGWSYAAMDLPMKNIKLYLRNNYFRNLVQPVHPFGGQDVATYNANDTLIYENNTFFNTSAYIVLPQPDERCNYIKFDHNTIFTTIINPFFVPSIQNAEFTNNIFYGILAMGQKHEEIEAGWYGWDNAAVGIMNYDTMSTELQQKLGMEESARRIVHKNNVWFNPQKIVDYWTAFVDSIPVTDVNGDTTGWTTQPLTPTVWMNANTQAMFDDKDNYPNFIDENTIYADPEFDPTMAAAVIDSVVNWVSWWRNGLGWESSDGPARQINFGNDNFDLPWPFPETLTYSNAELATASTEGLHLGDLNWYPEEKAQWTDIETENTPLEYKFTLYQNYPNPFNPSTVIKFSIKEQSNVSLDVFNTLGQKVATLINKELSAGNYKYTFDGSKLSSGVYFYRLKSGNSFVQIKKMLLLK